MNSAQPRDRDRHTCCDLHLHKLGEQATDGASVQDKLDAIETKDSQLAGLLRTLFLTEDDLDRATVSVKLNDCATTRADRTRASGAQAEANRLLELYTAGR